MENLKDWKGFSIKGVEGVGREVLISYISRPREASLESLVFLLEAANTHSKLGVKWCIRTTGSTE